MWERILFGCSQERRAVHKWKSEDRLMDLVHLFVSFVLTSHWIYRACLSLLASKQLVIHEFCSKVRIQRILTIYHRTVYLIPKGCSQQVLSRRIMMEILQQGKQMKNLSLGTWSTLCVWLLFVQNHRRISYNKGQRNKWRDISILSTAKAHLRYCLVHKLCVATTYNCLAFSDGTLGDFIT